MSYESLSRDLHSILDSYLDLVGCDGGSIYTIQKNLQGESVLVFKAMVTRSVGIRSVPEALKSVVFRLDESTLAGKTGMQQKVFKENYLESKMTADGMTAVSLGTLSNQKIPYTTQTILSAPLITPRGDLVGVVQLVNKLDVNGVFAEFSEKDERLCGIVSSQAALAIENSTLLIEQEKILDGFVNACVTAIEARDPVTSGHSQRVCDLTVQLAEAVNRTSTGTLASIQFSATQFRELRYAAMLHDIGKISVKEDLLKKEKKLFPWELELIEMRFKLMKSAIKNEFLVQGSGQTHDLELARRLRELDRSLQMIKVANEPSLLPQEVSQGIVEMTKIAVQIDETETCCALTHHEKDRLCIARGSLSREERIEIEKHVSFTYEILKMVPWSRGLEMVPEIAHRHHEKLDGTGYPLKVKGEMIPVQTRMLTICDIYDALTAKDRPYKAAVPLDKAMAILEDEVKQGKLDPILFKLFVDSKSYIIVTPEKKAA